ncbi:MAG: glycosyltransferase [Sphingobacteriales bacterium]|nr:glycosyltransferase [Sphingobacteriales bacterium]OJW03998.1 MAG: hypothetical protein BGO52_17815 [Sphingobacteriales bacterium 44-61]
MELLEKILWIIWALLQVVIAGYIAIPFLFVVIYGLLRLFRVRTPFQRKPFLTDRQFDFAFIITAHQETKFVYPLVDSILKQSYGNFIVYLVADDCQQENISFADARIRVLKPEPALHSKIKSIRYAIAKFERKPDAIIILDADNLIHPSFLDTMNQYFRKGYRVVQSQFKPKNTDTDYARMDAIGDMFNFFIEREMRMRMGMSSAIWGSGVAVDTDMYNAVEYKHFLGGFDKKLQAYLVQNTRRIAYAEEAILFDEKITSGASLETQRTRWISSYFKYFKESFVIFFKGLLRFDINLMYFGYILLRPPLFMVLGLAGLFTVINFFIWPLAAWIWVGLWASFLVAFAAIVLIKGKDARFLATFFKLPLFAGRQFLALIKVRKAKKSFLKTQHTSLVYIDDLIK